MTIQLKSGIWQQDNVFPIRFGHNACVWSVAFHPAGQILATAGECVQTLQGHLDGAGDRF